MSDSVYYRYREYYTLDDGSNSNETTHRVERIYEGLVVDVILDHKHPEHAEPPFTNGNGGDGFNVGTIKVRIFDVSQSTRKEFLSYAFPIETGVTEYPLIGELVTLMKIRGAFFYTKKVSMSRLLQENAMVGMDNALEARLGSSLANALNSGEDVEGQVHSFGTYFQPDKRIRKLKHFEGDSLYEGRMGHSIRFGSSKVDPMTNGLAPTLILRTGQAKDIEVTEDKYSVPTPWGIILEDVNKDVTSLWMVTDQHVPFTPTTRNAGSFYRSIANPPNKYDGASAILNSNTLLLNAKNKHIMMFSNEEIYLNSLGRTSIDSDENIILSANLNVELKASRYIENTTDNNFYIRAGNDVSSASIGKTSILSNKTFIGSVEDFNEPMVAGTSLSKFLARMIQVLMGTGVAPIGVDPARAISPGIAATAHGIFGFVPVQLNPIIISGLSTLYTELTLSNPGISSDIPFSGAPFNSQDNFVNIDNESPEDYVVLNEFENGEPIVVEDPIWELSGENSGINIERA